MKKRLLFVIVGLVLILSVMAPVQVFAAPKAPTKFSASGETTIISYGNTQVLKQAGPLVFESTQGEVVTCLISSSDWSALKGATVETDHNAYAILNMQNGTLHGTGSGTIQVTATDGSKMQGTYFAVLSGIFHFDQQSGEMIFDSVSDTILWDFEGTSGIFTGITAKGNASATMSSQGDTLVGSMNLSGFYSK